MTKNKVPTFRMYANQTVFELVTGFRRETGNQLRLLVVLMTGLLVPMLLLSLALATQNAASNLESRRHISAFAADFPAASLDTLQESLINHHQIEHVTILPATDAIPMIAEIKPLASLTDKQIESLAIALENTDAFNFVSINHQLLKRNTAAYLKAKQLALVFFLFAMVLAASTCMLVIKREMLRSNSHGINLQRQLGATATAISKPFVARAAVLTVLAMIGAAILVTVFYKTIGTLVNVSSYSTLLMGGLPISHLLLLAIVSVTAACFAAITALQSIFVAVNQLFRRIKPGNRLTYQPMLMEN